jgi:CO/xanthine dehydrogenase FAD-binding subunit
MRGLVPEYELAATRTLPEALELVAAGCRPLAGGTDLMALLEAGALAGRRFVDIRQLAELRGIEVAPGRVTLGALTTYTEVRRHAVLSEEFPLLAAAARETGGLATQNRGTLGGNIVNASPAADSPPALLAYEAELELVSTAGARRVPYRGFHTGYKQMDLAPGEILARIVLPRASAGWRQYYRKVGARRAQAISKVVFAGLLRVEAGAVTGARIALGSVAPTVVRCAAAEAALIGRPLDADTVGMARRALEAELRPIDDLRSTATYRRRVAGNLLEDFLQPQGRN